MRLRFSVLAFVVLLLAGCGKPTVTGVYVAKSQNSVALLDLVQVDSGVVTGRLQWIGIQQDGDLSDIDASVSGLSDGKSISLAAKPVAFLPVSTQMTGKLSRGKLTVNMGDAYGSVEFTRSDTNAFHEEANKLRGRSRTILAARAAQEAAQAAEEALQQAVRQATAARTELLQRIVALTPRMQELKARLERAQTRSPAIAAGYSKVTDRMAALLEKERSLVGRQDQSYQREQLSYAIQDGPNASERVHLQVRNSVADLDRVARALGTDLASARADCRALPPMDTEPPLAEACVDLERRMTSFADPLRRTGEEIRALEQAYAREIEKQKRIAAEAQRIE